MKRSSCIAILGIAFLITLLLCPPVMAELTFSGDLEIDTSYATDDDDDYIRTNAIADEDRQTTTYDSSGRIKIAPDARTQSGNLYMEAYAQILAKTYNKLDGDVQGVQIDDAWGKIGTSTFDFQIGRWEAWDLFAKSNDMLIVGAPNGAARYETNNARGRLDGTGQLAIHILPSDTFKLEVATVYGHDGTENKMGLRPVVDLKFGIVEVLGGFDYVTTTSTNDDDDSETNQFGYGARVQATFGIATLYLNYAHEVEGGKDWDSGTDTTTDRDDETTTSYGGVCDLALGPGTLTLGALMTTWEQDNQNDKSHLQYYAAYAHPLPIEGATIKFAVSFANATEEAAGGDIDSSASGFKVRLNYNF